MLLAALSSSVYVINHEILFWPERQQQTLGALALGAAVLLACAAPFVNGIGARASQIALLVLAWFALGEVRRLWLRASYRVPSPAAQPSEGWRANTTLDLRVRHYDVARAPQLGQRLRIVQITDLHVTEALPFAYYERLSAEVKARHPDVIALTGDLLSERERLPLLEAWLATLPRAPLGNFAVLGNHEYWAHADNEVTRALERAGTELIAGRCRTLSTPAPGIRLCGTEAPWGPPLSASALHAEANLPFVVLSHTPDNVYDLADLGALAVLAGHTHGGQLRVPWVGPIIVPSRFGRRFDVGHFKIARTHLLVSAGVGADAPPFRAFCPPELVELDLSL